MPSSAARLPVSSSTTNTTGLVIAVLLHIDATVRPAEAARWLVLAIVLVVPAAGGDTAVIVNHQPKHTQQRSKSVRQIPAGPTERRNPKMTGTAVVLDASTIGDERR